MIKNTLKEKINKVRDMEATSKDHVDVMYSRPSHLERKRIILEVMEKYVQDRDFLDVGCAEGLYCNETRKYKARNVLGIDISEKKIVRARELYTNLEFKVVDSDCITESLDKTFNFILCTEVLQHILDYKKTIREVLSILRESGYLLLTVPNLSKTDHHVFAKINDKMSVEELLREVGGAGHGKQNAIWKFNTKLLGDELVSEYPLDMVEMIPIDTPDGEIKNLWTVFLLRKRSGE